MADQLEAWLNEGTEELPPEAVNEEPEEKTGEDIPAAAVPPETPAPPVEDLAAKIKAFETAMIEERRKRQAAEAALQAKQEEEKPYLGEEYEARFKEEAERTKLEIQNTKIALSEEFAKEKYSDYDEKIDVFKALAAEHPELIKEMRANPNPAGFAYKVAERHKKMQEMANPDEYEQKLRAKIEAEFKAKYEAESSKRETLPGSLANTRGVAGTHTPEWTGPPALKDILK